MPGETLITKVVQHHTASGSLRLSSNCTMSWSIDGVKGAVCYSVLMLTLMAL